MSLLQRYKRSGGFVQLLSLLETFGVQKKEKFLEMIDAESTVWAKALRDKMLTVDRILGWPDEVVIEVLHQLPPKTQAIAIENIKPEEKARISKYYSPSELRRLNDVLSESKVKPDEAAAVMVKFVEQARKMLMERVLHPERFDEALLIPENFEGHLEERSSGEQIEKSGGVPTGAAVAATAAVESADVLQLQRSLSGLLKENKALKDEVRILREKLDQIRKIA